MTKKKNNNKIEKNVEEVKDNKVDEVIEVKDDKVEEIANETTEEVKDDKVENKVEEIKEKKEDIIEEKKTNKDNSVLETPNSKMIALTIFTVVAIILVCVIFRSVQNQNKGNKPKFVSEIKENELTNYTKENNEVVIYIASSKNKENDKVEKDLKEYTIKHNLKSKYVYLDLAEVGDKFYDKFYSEYTRESYSDDFKISEPTLVLIKEGKIQSYINNLKNADQIEEFFVTNGVE